MQSTITGSIPSIIRNDERLYEGDLVHYFQAIFKHAPNLRHPYHNFRHMLHVTWLCYQACEFYKGNMCPLEMRKLLVAAMFHDFDHLGTFGNDHANILRSVDGLDRYIQLLDTPYRKDIHVLIEATEYPHTSATESLSLSGKIIRDADLCQVFSPAWIQHVVFGLASEWGRSPVEVLRMQHPFLSNIKLETEWARIMYPATTIQEKIDEAVALLELLET